MSGAATGDLCQGLALAWSRLGTFAQVPSHTHPEVTTQADRFHETSRCSLPCMLEALHLAGRREQLFQPLGRSPARRQQRDPPKMRGLPPQ